MERYLKIERSTLSKIKRSIVKMFPRQFHCYCLGAEKTGTTSIHNMFRNHYRTSHEADPKKTIRLVIDYLEGDISKRNAGEILKKRDKILNLKIESAHHLVYVSDILNEIFPDAKFIITVREPYALLDSRLNWHRTPNHPGWDNYIEYFLENSHSGYEDEEKILKDNNLYSLDTYLNQYSDHYKRVLKNIPKEKRIIIKTNNLNNSIEKIASFLEISSKTIQIAHSKKNKKKIKILEQMDQIFVRQKIWEHCSDLIQEFFPETIHLYK